MIKNNKINGSLFLIGICFSFLPCQSQYSDIYSMLHNITSFENEIELDYLNVEYSNNMVSSIHWFDHDSIKFTRLFHYDNDNLFLISEFREQTILKEIYFTSYNRAERFIDFIFGEEFQTDEQYITEIIYNKSKLPVSYRIKSTQNDYIGHMTLNYDTNDNLIREAWFQNKKKIKEFVK